MPVLPGGLQVFPVGSSLGGLAVGAFDPADVVGSSPLVPPRPGILKGMHFEGRSLVESKSGLDHLGLLSASPKFASMERESEMSALFVSCTPVLDAPAFLLQTPFGSLR